MSLPTARRAGSGTSGKVRPFVVRFRLQIQLLDCVVVLLAVLGAAAVPLGGVPATQDPARQSLALALVLIWPIMLWQRQSTATTILGQGPAEYHRVLTASVSAAVLVAAIAYATATTTARGFLLVAFMAGSTLLLLERHTMRLVLHRRLAAGEPLHRVFVIASAQREALIRAELTWSDSRFEEVGYWHLSGSADPDPDVVIAAARSADADTILYAPLGTTDLQWTRRLGWALEDSDLSLLVSPSLVEVAGPRMTVEPVAGLAFVRVAQARFSGPALVAKRALDVVGSLLALVVLAVPLLLIAVWVKLDSPGPVLFRQQRMGVRSTVFQCWKFRTMYDGADAQREALRAAAARDLMDSVGSGAAPAGGATFKLVDDPRITRAGRFLRRYSLDELPQLVNVLRGQMSLVGPRPHPLDDVSRYDDQAHRRLLAKPGITGLWQVSGRSDLDWDQAMRLDLYYVENWSLAVDLLILARTVKAVITGAGAY